MTDSTGRADTDTVFLYSEEVWDKINAVKPNSPKWIATAYIGVKAKFDWKAGDVLLVGLSKENVKSGLVDPYLLERLITEYGVLVYKCETLHGKVFLFEKCAIVGSMNLTGNSQGPLLEACIYTTAEAVKSSIKSFFSKFLIDKQKVKLSDLESFKLIFKTEINLSYSAVVIDSARFWLFNTHKITIQNHEIPKKDLVEFTEKNEYIQRLLHFGSQADLYSQVHKGDVVIELHKDHQNKLFLFPPLLYIASEVRGDWRHMYFKMSKKPAIEWDLIKHKFSIDEISYNGAKEIRDLKDDFMTRVKEIFDI